MKERPQRAQKGIQTIMDLFAAGALQTASPLHVRSIGDINNVFRFLADGKSSGKVVVEMKLDAEVSVSPKYLRHQAYNH